MITREAFLREYAKLLAEDYEWARIEANLTKYIARVEKSISENLRSGWGANTGTSCRKAWFNLKGPKPTNPRTRGPGPTMQQLRALPSEREVTSAQPPLDGGNSQPSP